MRDRSDNYHYDNMRVNFNQLSIGNYKPGPDEHLAQEHLSWSTANTITAGTAPSYSSPASPRPSFNNQSSSSFPSPQSTPKRPNVAPAGTASDINPADYTEPFMDFITNNPTVFHTVDYVQKRLEDSGFKRLRERDNWELTKGGKYYVSRNQCSLIAFVVGENFKSGNGFSIVAGHIDALCLKLKPVSSKPNSYGYVSLGVAPYAGALSGPTWWDRDLSIGGRVIVKNPRTGRIESKLVKIDWPIAKIPSLAPHFGRSDTNNKETQMFPIIGLEGAAKRTSESPDPSSNEFKAAPEGAFAHKQPPRLVELIASELGIKDLGTILNWELELFDSQPAQLIGMDKELLSSPRIDDKINSWAAVEALISAEKAAKDTGVVSMVALFDEEEIGSRLRDGAASNLLPSTIARVNEAIGGSSGPNTLNASYARSFLLSADVTHAVSPEFGNFYLRDHTPRLNVGITVVGDSNGHMTTDSISHALLQEVAERSGSELQIFQIRNDSRSGGTIGPMLSTAMGIRAIDAGVPQLSMHSIRATVGSLDAGLAVKLFAGFFEHYESVDASFED